MKVDFDSINSREIYEINELYNTGNPKLIDIAQQIKEASAKAMRDCIEKDNPDFSIFGEIEQKAIKNEEKAWKNQKKTAKHITKSILQTNHGYWPKPIEPNEINYDQLSCKEGSLFYPNSLQSLIKEEQYKKTIKKVIDLHTSDV